MNHPLRTLQRFLARPAAGLAAAFLLYAGGPCVLCSFAAEAVEAAGDGAEILTRGPVHEGFAETISFKPTPGILVPRAAPAAIEELPPEQRPDGDNVTWIPGYWAWDDETSDFLWVSGIWRNLPPGRQWIPGYWADSGAEFQWVSGYWADAAAGEVEYLAEPPDSIEAGPNIEAPSREHAWTPGSWMWQESRYRWRPGYWQAAQPNWVWIPSYYVRTPRGWVFVNGYWDYDVSRRGMIFAPVRFSGNYYARPDYRYRPATVINLALFLDHLFVRPRHRHYYFGDYYAPAYRRSGYYASYSYYSGGHGYDPIYAHERWNHRSDKGWERRNEENFRYFRDNEEQRPPRTFAAFQQYTAKPDKNRRVDSRFATPLSEYATTGDKGFRLKPVNEDESQRFVKQGREIREFGDQRRKLGKEAAAVTGGEKPGKGGPDRVKLPRSPIFQKPSDKPSLADTPPVHREVPAATDKTGGKSGRGDKGKKVPAVENGNPPRIKPIKPDPKDLPPQEPKAGSKDGPRGKTKREPAAETPDKPNRKPEVTPKRTAEEMAKKNPPSVPKPRTKTVPKAEPKREPRVEPKREPKAEVKPPPRVEPKAEPKIEPKRTPKTVPQEKPKPKVKAPATPKKGRQNPDDKEKDKDRDKRLKP